MEVKSFAVSVQWGKGMHYFKRTDIETQTEADRLAYNLLRGNEKRANKRGAQPTFHVWKLVSSIILEPNKDG